MSDIEARLFFAGELAGLLTCPNSMGNVRYPVDRRASIKDVVEALGVPHTEVYSIRCRGAAHGFDLLMEPGMRVAFMPADLSESYPVDVTMPTQLRPDPLPGLRFLVDENVAGLVPLLRALGFDTVRDRAMDRAAMAQLAAEEKRVVLTRDRALLKLSVVTHGRLIRSQVVDDQLLEVLDHFKVVDSDIPFSRCLKCNDVTHKVDKASILHLLEPKTKLFFEDFRQCPACGSIYWAGSHYERLVERFARLGVLVESDKG